MNAHVLVVGLLALTACDPVFLVDVTVDIPSEVMAEYSPEHRGVVVLDSIDDTEFIFVICNSGPDQTVTKTVSGLGSRCPEGTDIRSWVVPFDAETPCWELDSGAKWDPAFDDLQGWGSPTDDMPQGSVRIPKRGDGCGDTLELTLRNP